MRSSSHQHSQPPLPPLPPPDEQMLELERLLAQAKVGSHELTSGETSPAGLRFPAAHQNDQFAQQLQEACDTMESKEDAVVVETCYSAPDDDDDEDSGVVVMEAPSSSESSGVLVEAHQQTEHESNNLMPQPLTIIGTPKFHFYSDEKAVPKQLTSIQLQSLRNRHAFQSRLHDVECRLALLTAQLADEEMALQRDVKEATTTCVYQPVQKVMEHVSRHSEISLAQRWLTLEQRCSQMDAQMTHGIHVRAPDWRRDASINVSDLAQTIQATALLADTKDVAQARRWEGQVGSMERRLQEEQAARVAAMDVMDQTLHKIDPHRGQELLDVIRSLRSTVEQEREERISSDDQIRDYILKSTEAMKQAILGAYVDPESEDF